MTIAYDAVSSLATDIGAADTFATFNHTPVGTPSGILIWHLLGTASGAANPDRVVSIEYGGVPVPFVTQARDSANEQALVSAYFLEGTIPTGVQAVDITYLAEGAISFERVCICISITADMRPLIVASDILEENIANPQIAIATDSTAMRFTVIGSGAGAPGVLTPLAGMSAILGIDLGSTMIRTDRETTPSNGSFTIGWTGGEDDVAMVALAIADADIYEPFEEADTFMGFQATNAGGVLATYGFFEDTSETLGWVVNPILAEYGFFEDTSTFLPFAVETPFAEYGFFPEDDTFMAFGATNTDAPVLASYGFFEDTSFFRSFTAYNPILPVPPPPPDIGLARGSWNSGIWTVWLADRFGEPLRQLKGFASISGSPLRVIDDVSDITVEFGDNCDEDLLCVANPWANELQLRLDGEIAWAGPIQNPEYTYTPDTTNPITITAADLLQWLSVRLLEGRIAKGPVATQYAQIIQEAMRGDNIGLFANAQFISVDGPQRITDISDALSEISDLSPLLDYTMHQRKLLVGKEEVPFATLPTLLLPEHAVSFTLKRLGDEEASQMFVRGGDDLDEISQKRAEGAFPQTRVPDPSIGIVQRRVIDTMSVLTDDVATTIAYSAYQYARPPLWAIDVELDMQRVPFRFNDIIAGATVPVSIPGLACFGATRVMRVKSLSLNISASGQNAGESVTLELRPAGVFTDDLSAIALGF